MEVVLRLSGDREHLQHVLHGERSQVLTHPGLVQTEHTLNSVHWRFLSELLPHGTAGLAGRYLLDQHAVQNILLLDSPGHFWSPDVRGVAQTRGEVFRVCQLRLDLVLDVFW